MLFEIDDLAVSFARPGGNALAAVRGASLNIERGETVGLVGESGCGKSVTALAVMRILEVPGFVAGGRVLLDGVDLLKLPEKQMRDIRGKRIAWVPQDPLTSLNPVLTIGTQLVETIQAHRKVAKRDAVREAISWLERVHIPNAASRMRQYPHEMSGGMRQRVMIAMAFALRADLLIADEPTTALDMTVQAQILNLMDELKAEHGTAVLLITHDLGIVAERTDRVAVMYAGQIIEQAATRSLFEHPRHPYTRALLASLPDVNRPRDGSPLPYLEGRPPQMRTGDPPQCAFAARCSSVMPQCIVVEPKLSARGETAHPVRCLLYDEPTDQ